MHNEGDLILALTCLLMMKAIMTIGKDRELLQARPSLTKKGTTGGAKVKAYLLGAWEVMPWAGHWINSPNHPSHTTLKGLHSLSDSSSQASPFTMTIQTPWSMWASLTKGCLSTPKTRHWCVRFSHPAWNQWRWGGSMA